MKRKPPHIRTHSCERTSCFLSLALSGCWIQNERRFVSGFQEVVVFITRYLLDKLISFTVERVFEWDRWYCSLVYFNRKEEGGDFGRVWSWSEKDQLSQNRRQQVRDTWCPQAAWSFRKGRRKACLGWVYAIILGLHPACLGHVSPAASLGTAWNF